MHPGFLPLLCCPGTRAELYLEARETDRLGRVITGTLRSTDGTEYPIVRGVPRFVAREHYASTFGYEWNRWPRVQFESENLGKPMAGHTTRMWEVITDQGSGDLSGRTLVEYGCGPGRFLDVVRHRGGRAVGLDMSLAVEAAARNFADDRQVLIVQGDVLNPPFRPGVFDAGYSIGVLHHTPDPAIGARELVRVVRPGGWIAVSVYGQDGFYDCPAVARHRRLHRLLRPIFGHKPALVYAHMAAHGLAPAFRKAGRIRPLRPALGWLRKNWLVVLTLPDARWSKLDVFDAITPEIATCHTADEVHDWLTRAGVESIHETAWGPTSQVGLRAGKTHADRSGHAHEPLAAEVGA